MNKRIVIAVTNNLQTDQRVFRVSDTLIKQGYKVFLVGRKTDQNTHANFPTKSKLFRLWFNKGGLFYANYNIRLWFFLLFHRYDIILSNDLDSLPASYLAAKIQNKAIVYDSHEYFTEVPELEGRELQKKVWLWFEKRILPKLKHTYTVCDSIAQAYNQKYACDFKVIRNLPSIKPKANNKASKSVLIYQGAIQKSRGIELMIESMQYLEGIELWIVGKGYWEDTVKTLSQKLKVNDKVKFLGGFKPKDLAQITPQASIGLSLEEEDGLSYQYALPNKLFDYIQAQIPVLVSDLIEMKRIVENYQIGEVLYERTPQKLASAIKEMLSDTAKQESWKENLEKAAEVLNWENESKVLLDIFSKIP